jgi:hypothetical protein
MTLTPATCVRREIAAMEAALMKLLGAIGISGLLLLLGSTAAAYAPQEQSDKPEKQEEKAKPEKQDKQDKPAKQEAKQAKQEPQDKPAKQEAKQAKQEPQDKPAKQEAKQAKQEPQDKPEKQDARQAKQEPQDKHVKEQDQRSAQQSQRDGGNRAGGGDHGRISDDHYRASFGSGHNFHVNRGDYDHRRFDYGGYSFGFIDPWPVGWGYTDNVYVVYDDGAYYMYDVVHPGIRISVSIL